jgi:hypothetical protein
MTKEEIIEMAKKCGWDNPAINMSPLYEFANLVAEKERERIKEQNAPEIEKTNAYIKQLELEKMESDILHNEHLKLLGEIRAMTEAARSAEREACAKACEEEKDIDGISTAKAFAEIIRARGNNG